MNLWECVDWRKASINAYTKCREAEEALPILKAQLEASEGEHYIRAKIGKNGNNKTQEAWLNELDNQKILKSRIDELKNMTECMATALGKLNDQERDMLSIRYGAPTSPQIAIMTICQKYGYEKTKVYDMLSKATEHLALLLYGAQ